MANTVRDLREYYPLVVTQADIDAAPWLPDVLINVLDARLVLPVSGQPDALNGALFSVRLVELHPDTAVVSVSGLPGAGNGDYSVPVHVGRDNDAGTVYEPTRGWFLVEKTILTDIDLSGIDVLVHPDCLLLEQLGAELSFMTRPYDAWEEDAEQVDGAAAVTAPAGGVVVQTAAIADGYNVHVRYNERTGDISLVGTSGGGLGLLPTSLYLNGADLDAGHTSGLRSVNGIQEACDVVSDGVVLVNATGADDVVELNLQVK